MAFLITAMFILTEIEDISRFPNAERFASFIGLIPMTHSSGSKEKVGEITFRSHNYLRSAFDESAWIAIRRDPALLMASYKNNLLSVVIRGCYISLIHAVI